MSESGPGHYDVAIVGGGPGGSTTGAMLRKYNPRLRIAILEREKFPRDHIGESQLPPIGRVLHEMGAWDKVEAAGFPIKFGATYTWGKTTEPWTFGFIPNSMVRDDPRPAPFEGWRQRVAMQVDRSVYDKVLLDHARDLGCEVMEETRVSTVEHADDVISALVLADGRRITARHYVDASGNAAVIRRAMGVHVDIPTLLRNVAFWDYWTAPDMNARIWEGGAIRIHIRSLPFGWVWYIALSRDRTSVGIVCNAEFYKHCGKRPETLYDEAIHSDATIVKLLGNARPRGTIDSTTDWSFLADRAYGKNWFLCGESLGFADPILSAGLTLTHTCARHLAYTIIDLDRSPKDRQWVLDQYQTIQRRRVLQHIKFADYWYSGNGLFSAIHENCAKIASEAGLRLSPADAFRWLSNGGIDDEIGQVAIGGLDLAGIKQVQMRLSHDTDEPVTYAAHHKNHFRLNLDGAARTTVAKLENGRLLRVPAYTRGAATLVLAGGYAAIVSALEWSPHADDLLKHVQKDIAQRGGGDPAKSQFLFTQVMQCLEAMVAQDWVRAEFKPGRAALAFNTPYDGDLIYSAKPV